ncbi:MAG TPA: UPF0280 family protein [Patescibacteria group bacterium]|nr:UPF0280 family protein [Patescibacteria group bacterium]
MITRLADHQIFLDYGPMQMTLSAWQEQRPMREELLEAAQYSMERLTELAAFLPAAKGPADTIPEEDRLPISLRYMLEGVRAARDASLTPMAAVAGSFADLAAEYLQQRGATKVLVNNGGDVAIRLRPGEKTRVGILPAIDAIQFTHTVEVAAEDGIGGVATSGLGGRSLTKGIASSVTVLAGTARVADSCATLIANHCNVDDDGILRRRAEDIDPDTDIRGHWVTVAVPALSNEKKQRALAGGMEKARELMAGNIIRGAVLFVGEWMDMVPGGLCRAWGSTRNSGGSDK